MKAFTLFFLLAFLFVGCAAGPNDLVGQANDSGDLAGFWKGLWHGFIMPISWFISLFDSDVTIYEVHNSGGWYTFGFWLGVSTVYGGGTTAGRKVRNGGEA